MKLQKFGDRTVVGPFDLVGKITGGQLMLTPVIGHTLATNPLAGARLVGAIAVFLIDRDLAFHPKIPHEDVCISVKEL